jgi:hypothetical protein
MRALLACAVVVAASTAAGPAHADDAACIAASEQALTFRQQGKLHDALKELAACADASCPAEVSAECTRRIAEVNAAMPTLILAAEDGVGNDVYDVNVSMDGAPLATKLDGRPLSIDPGPHTFTFERAGQSPVDRKLVVREGDHDRRESLVLAPPQATVPQVPQLPPVLAPPGVPSSGWSTRKTLAVVVGAVGVVGLGVGGTFGILALSNQMREKSDCSTSECLNPVPAKSEYTIATQDATAADVAFAVGAALVAAGAVIWFTAPATHAPATNGATLRLAPSMAGGGAGGVLLLGDF